MARLNGLDRANGMVGFNIERHRPDLTNPIYNAARLKTSESRPRSITVYTDWLYFDKRFSCMVLY